ncbi:MAG TPA: sigma-70 family RNA polymerase sigma factor [Longimicrobiales bacterium]
MLLAQTAAGDGQAYEQLVSRHQAAVFRFLHATLRDVADAEDAMQETFVAAWRSAGRYRGEAPVRAWLLGIARNTARHARRRRVGEPAEYVGLDDLGLEAGWGSEDPEQQLLVSLRRSALQAAFERLTESEREILVLRDLEDLAGDAVANVLGVTLAAMKSRLHRARLRLAAEVRKELEHA